MNASVEIIVPAFNASQTLEPCIESIYKQVLTSQWILNACIVNDGSQDQTLPLACKLKEKYNSIRIVNITENGGRATAINNGILSSNADIVGILDSDCWYATDTTLSNALAEYKAKNLKGLAGLTTSNKAGFWGKYLRDVNERRRNVTDHSYFTTANCLFDRILISTCGLFSNKYCRYGFEDRDLILRFVAMYGSDKLCLGEQFIALHDVGDLRLPHLAEKFYISGRYSAATFRADHLDDYKRSIYKHFDYNCITSTQRILLSLAALAANSLMQVTSRAIASELIFFPIKKLMVKIVVALYFFKGTKDAST